VIPRGESSTKENNVLGRVLGNAFTVVMDLVAQPPSAVKTETHNNHGARALGKRNAGDPSHGYSPKGGIIEPSASALGKLRKDLRKNLAPQASAQRYGRKSGWHD